MFTINDIEVVFCSLKKNVIIVNQTGSTKSHKPMIITYRLISVLVVKHC